MQIPNTQAFAVDTERTIYERPFSIIIRRDNGSGDVITLEPQTVRLDVFQNIRSGVELRDALMAISKQYVVLIGFKAHPTIPDTDIQRADTFKYQDRIYEIIEVVDTLPGRLMCTADLKP